MPAQNGFWSNPSWPPLPLYRSESLKKRNPSVLSDTYVSKLGDSDRPRDDFQVITRPLRRSNLAPGDRVLPQSR